MEENIQNLGKKYQMCPHYMQGTCPYMMYQQPMMYHQHMYQQPMHQQPMCQQPMYQQPMYQQPPVMPQQPMMQRPMIEEDDLSTMEPYDRVDDETDDLPEDDYRVRRRHHHGYYLYPFYPPMYGNYPYHHNYGSYQHYR